MPGRVRSAGEADLDRIVAIAARCFTQPWSRESFASDLARSWTRILVLERDDGVVVGFVHYWIVAGEFEVMNVAVDPDERRKRYGHELVSAMIREAHTENVRRIVLEVRAGNTAAIALYASFGFVESGRRPKYYDDAEDAVLMEWAVPAG
jgi:ribosomal-protein-alanine N-acetyltransferase